MFQANRSLRLLTLALAACLLLALFVPQTVRAEDNITVCVSVEKFTLGQGYIIEPTLVQTKAGSTAAGLLTELLQEKYPDKSQPWQMTGTVANAFYLSAVYDPERGEPSFPQYISSRAELTAKDGSPDWLGEFDYCPTSGWMYTINNAYPAVSAADYQLKDGDVMRWQFTLYGYGADLGADNSEWSEQAIANVGNKDALTLAAAKLRAENKSNTAAYKAAVAALSDPEASQSKLDDTLQNLNNGGNAAAQQGNTNPAAAANPLKPATPQTNSRVDTSLPHLTALNVNGGIQYTPVNVQDTLQQFVLEKNSKQAVISFTPTADTKRAALCDADGKEIAGGLTPSGDSYSFVMPASQMTGGRSGAELTRLIKLENAAGAAQTITVTGACRLLDGPDTIVGYLCPASQYTDGGNPLTGIYGLYPEKALIGTGFWWSPISLGNFGGYITYYYADAVKNDPNNPYGVDFIIYGNTNGGSGFAEPGAVQVSQDGKTWYDLAGSEHYEDLTQWNKTVTYQAKSGEQTVVTIKGNQIRLQRPDAANYPLHDWQHEAADSVRVSGVMLANIFPAFGYADVHTNGLTAWGTGESVTLNAKAKNPYWPVTEQTAGLTGPDQTDLYEGAGDCFDLAWAVDEKGLPVELDEVHYIKIQTAMLTGNTGGTGEKSTEVNSITKVQPNAQPVGQSSAPAAITVDGEKLPLQAGVFEYTVQHPLGAGFTVQVDAPGSNVYIGSQRGDERFYMLCPQKKLLRIIVQQDDKEPLQYFIHLQSKAPEREAVQQALQQSMRKAGLGAAAPVSRAALFNTLYELSGQPPQPEVYFLYREAVSRNDWSTKALTWAVNNGIAKCWLADHEYLLDDEKPVTRTELAVMLARYAALARPEVTLACDTAERVEAYRMQELPLTKLAANDAADVAEWGLEAADWAVKSGLLPVDGSNNWQPAATFTVSELTDILANFYLYLLQ